MDIQFNFVDKKRKPTIILCNPNGQELYALGLARDVEYSKALNELSEMSFEIPKYKDEEIMPYYYDIKSSKYIKVDGVGVYIIKSTKAKKKGTSQEYKSVSCVGLEYELSSRNLDVLDGTYCLYDATNANTEKSIIHIVLSYLPNWAVSSVDSDLWDKWRTFSIQDTNIFNFLMSDISKTYDCVFLFDTFNRQIKVVKTANLKKQSDVYMSGRNIIKELDIDDDSDSLVTALNVYGDGDLSIRTVNPLGTPTLYNFDYFMTTEWMSQELIDALSVWKLKKANAKTQFSDMLLQLKTKQNELTVLESQLKDLESTGKSLDQGQSLAIKNGDNASCSAYANEIKSNNVLIEAKKQQIQTKKTEISSTEKSLLQIPQNLSINNTVNFSDKLRKELDPYIKQASVQNTDYAVTDDMTNDEIMDVANQLMTWGEDQLNKSSQPIWTFDVDAVNFLNLIEYKHVADQLDLGSEVTIEVDKKRDMYANAMLIGYKITLDKPDNIKLGFSSALNFRRSTYTYEELFDKTASISKSYDFESPSWKKGKDAYDTMNSYIEKGFVDITKDVLSADNQQFEISNTGIRGREYLPETNTYSPEELRMTKNVLAFSDDNFNTTKTAIGKIKLPDGTSVYGVSAEVLVGKQILGKNLFLETEDKSLTWNGQGLTIRNANILMTNDKNQEVKLDDYVKGTLGGILTPTGLLDTTKLEGTIMAGENNIQLGTGTNRVILNDSGILMSKNSGSSWSTAISPLGIVADAIQSGGTISGCKFVTNDGDSTLTIFENSIYCKKDKITYFSLNSDSARGGYLNLQKDINTYLEIVTQQQGYGIGDSIFSTAMIRSSSMLLLRSSVRVCIDGDLFVTGRICKNWNGGFKGTDYVEL